MRLRVHGVTVLVLVTLVSSGCSLVGGDDATPDDAAQRLAQALTSGRWRGVEVSAATTAEARRRLSRIVDGMDDHRRSVEVVDVAQDTDDQAAATLRWRWDVAGRPWTYETSLELTRDAEAWTVDFAPSVVHPSLRGDETLEATTIGSRRGDILGADGVRLVVDRPVERIGIDRTRVDGARAVASARRLAAVLGIDAADFADQVRSAGEDAFVEGLVLRADEVPPRVRTGLGAIRGALAVSDEIPLAPTREFARPILGTVGPVTAEVIEESDGRYEVGDEVGLSGLQQRYEDRLAGQPGVLVEAVSASADRSRRLFRTAPRHGGSLRTTLDPALQTSAERALADVAPASAVVAVRPSDGHVLAAASGPGSGGYSTATLGQYAPGSTFKVVTSLALLRAGMSPRSTVACTDSLTVDGKPFKNYDDYPASALGDITLWTAVANSCNTAFISERDRASQGALARAAAALGLGRDHDLGFPVFLGSVPAAAGATEHAASMIGQGKVLASPLAMATVASSVAAGKAVLPQLVLDHRVETTAPQTPVTDEEAEQLREMMRAVVTDGSASFLAGVPGDPVLAKTGTAEFGDSVPLDTHAWMVAVQGDLAVAVFVDTGDSGSRTAGPVLESFLRSIPR